MATNKDELRNKLKELNNELLKATLQDKVCNVVFKTDNDYNKYSKEGFKLNGNKFELLLGTPGGIKNNSVIFVVASLFGSCLCARLVRLAQVNAFLVAKFVALRLLCL